MIPFAIVFSLSAFCALVGTLKLALREEERFTAAGTFVSWLVLTICIVVFFTGCARPIGYHNG